MKKIFLFLMLSLLLVGFVVAQEGAQVQVSQDDGSGEGMVIVDDDVDSDVDDDSGIEIEEAGSAVEIEVEEEDDGERVKRKVSIRNEVNERARLYAGEVFAECDESCDLKEENSKLRAKLSNGRNAEVKVMPDTASETALERLRLKNCVEAEGCTLELKEVGSGDDVKLAYELKRERQAKFLGFIKTKMKVRAQVDAETGEVIKVGKPWWAFLASEPEETSDDTEETSE